MHKLTDDEKLELLSICSYFDGENRETRDRQIRLWKKLKFYWNGFSRVWWSNVAHDWRVYDSLAYYGQGYDNDAAFYDKRINVFKAYLESIIAALSATTPGLKCYPDDAQNPDDLLTAEAADAIAKLLAKHNNDTYQWIHALFIYCTEGTVFGYTYTDTDDKYGTYEINKYEDTSEEISMCPVCNSQIEDRAFKNEYDPESIEIGDVIESTGIAPCKSCGAVLSPETIKKDTIVVQRIVGKTTQPKSRQCFEVMGGLSVQVANYARSIDETPFLTYAHEVNPVDAIEMYPDLVRKGIKILAGPYGGSDSNMERWGRYSTQFMGTEPIDLATIQKTWLRPSAFNYLDTDRADYYKKLYPFGICITRVGGQFADAYAEKLNDHWSISHNPLDDYLHYDPAGLLLTSIQEITNDMNSLVLQTIEHGIPQTFYDPAVLDGDAYQQIEASPGMMIPAKPPSGKSLADGFYQIKTVSLSPEVQPYMNQIQEAGQLVSGALPSLFGGAQPNSSKTAAQYAMSKNQAMQRLQTPWKMLCIWWKECYGKMIPAYIKTILEQGDERTVEKNEEGNFINVVIRASQLQGKFGSVELEVSEELPLTWAQKKDTIMQLIGLNNDGINQAIFSPDNLNLMKQIIGIDEFRVPGEAYRQKQFAEIKLLLASTPISDPNTGQELPSVMIDPTIDNNGLEGEICKRWLISPEGRLAKVENTEGYKNVLLHCEMHLKAATPPPMMPGGNQQMPEKAPIQGNPNVRTN